jgi:hypothetical protein
MRNQNDLWEALGSVGEEETAHVLTKLFAMYDELIQQDPGNQEALNFFKKLDNALALTAECNLNRR